MPRAAAALVEGLTVQGHFPNLRTLLHGLSRRAGASDREPLPGMTPAFLHLPGPRGGERLPVREHDLPFFAASRFDDFKAHCGLIVRARSGDKQAALEIDAKAAALGEALERARARALSCESDFLATSLTERALGADAISHKGRELLKLSRLGYPVPDFAILTAQAYYQSEDERERLVIRALETLAAMIGRQAGLSPAPLVFAMRCAMPDYYPGVMPTFLNVGVSRETLDELGRAYGKQAALKMYLNNLRNLLQVVDRPAYEAAPARFKPTLSGAALEEAVAFAEARVGAKDPALLQDPLRQTLLLVREGYRYFEENQDLLLTLSRGKRHYPALILQQMVCSVRGTDSYAGVLFSRHSRTGSGFQLETARGVFGEEIMTGDHGTRHTSFEDERAIEGDFPAIAHFLPKLRDLEGQFEAPVMLELAVEAEAGRQLFALLQANVPGMTGRAALVSAVDLHQGGLISKKRVTELVCPYHVKQIESDTIDPDAIPEMAPFCQGVAILPRAAVSAQIYFSAEAALAGKRRGEKVCYCKRAFGPADAVVMQEMDAILSLTSAAIHVVTICQTFGSPSLLSLEKDGVAFGADEKSLVSRSGDAVREGDWITISSRRHTLFKGRARYKPARLLTYMRGETSDVTAGEKEVFDALAYAYHYYQRLVRGLQLDQITRLKELVRIVNLDLRGKEDEARLLINGWYDGHEDAYVGEVFDCELGDHLSQHRVFSMLTLERKTAFFKKALERCAREKRAGLAAGAFMLGRFLSTPLPAAFWKALTPAQQAVAVSEWVLFEKYLQVLFDVGERHVARARKSILHDGLGEIPLNCARVSHLLPLRLSGCDLAKARAAVPEWADKQAAEVLDLLGRPLREFYDPARAGEVEVFKRLCDEAGVPVPALS